MNLRKDHSHASNNSTVNHWREVLLGGWSLLQNPRQELEGGKAGWVLVTSFLFLSSCTLDSILYSVISSGVVVHSPELTTFSDGCLGSNNDEGRSEV